MSRRSKGGPSSKLHSSGVADIVRRAHRRADIELGLVKAPRYVICAVTSSKEQRIAEAMAAYRRRGYLIAARAKALGL